MSNDSRFWAVRVLTISSFLACAFLLFKAIGSAMNGGRYLVWIILFFGFLVALIPLAVAHTYYKSKRFSNDPPSIESEVEILAKFAQIQREKNKSK